MAKSVFNVAYQNDSITSKIVVGLERIAELYRVLLWDYAKIIGLSPIQIQVLLFIAFHELDQSTVSSLAAEFNVTKATMSDTIKSLVEKKLIKKIPSTTDKRTYSLATTKKGDRLVEQTEHFARPIENLVNRLSDSSQKELFKSIYSIIDNAQQQGLISANRMCKNCRFYEKKQNRHYCRFLDSSLANSELRIDCPEFEAK